MAREICGLFPHDDETSEMLKSRIRQCLKQFGKSAVGATMVEYALMLLLIAVVVVGLVAQVGTLAFGFYEALLIAMGW